jgi:hypothetical protein
LGIFQSHLLQKAGKAEKAGINRMAGRKGKNDR